jgi:hypothetical protein
MKVQCKYNNPDKLPAEIPDNFNYGLVLEKEYLVMGILLADEQLWYLIDENGKPNYYPFQLFEIIDNKINSGWHFRIYSEEDDVYPFGKMAVWGYYELCHDDKHYEDLVNRDVEAIHLYFKRKSEIN